MTAWNDTFTTDTDWSAAAFQQMFWTSINQRGLACGQITPATAYPLPAADDDISCATGSPAFGRFPWATLQQALESMAPAFANPSLVAVGDITAANNANIGSWNWTLSTWRAAAGINA